MKALILKTLLIVSTLLIYGVTYHAVQQLGADAGMIFITDFSHPWRAQFNTDFSLHIILLMLWVIWREKYLAVGILCGLGCLMGGLFTFPYLLVSLFLCGGDIRRLVLGRHAESTTFQQAG